MILCLFFSLAGGARDLEITNPNKTLVMAQSTTKN